MIDMREWITKEWVMKYWEQDWDDDNLYYVVDETGRIRKYDIRENQLFEYSIERVEN